MLQDDGCSSAITAEEGHGCLEATEEGSDCPEVADEPKKFFDETEEPQINPFSFPFQPFSHNVIWKHRYHFWIDLYIST